MQLHPRQHHVPLWADHFGTVQAMALEMARVGNASLMQIRQGHIRAGVHNQAEMLHRNRRPNKGADVVQQSNHYLMQQFRATHQYVSLRMASQASLSSSQAAADRSRGEDARFLKKARQAAPNALLSALSGFGPGSPAANVCVWCVYTCNVLLQFGIVEPGAQGPAHCRSSSLQV